MQTTLKALPRHGKKVPFSLDLEQKLDGFCGSLVFFHSWESQLRFVLKSREL